MSQKRVTLVIGTRPEAIKLAPLIKRFQDSELINTRVVLTGQHSDLVNDVVKLFSINIDLDLKLMKINQSLEEITCGVINGLRNEFKQYPPNIVIVQGDTSSAFAAALASFYQKIPVAHIEAGLRTDNLLNPFPEEANRRLVSQIATLHYAPTKKSKDNLLKSGIDKGVEITGNTVIDSLFMMRNKLSSSFLKELNLVNSKFLLCTFHRRENWGEKLESIIKAVLKILKNFPNIKVLIPIHPNKKVRDVIEKYLHSNPNAVLVEPLRYDQFVESIKECFFVITDSGGLQEEAPSFGKPVLVVRDTTERTEAIEAGTAKLIGTKEEVIFKEIKILINDESRFLSMARSINPYGDGFASLRIYKSILRFLEINH